MIARRLMQEGADWIVRAFDALGYEPGLRVCLWGGLGAEYKAYLPEEMAREVKPPVGDAATGAARIARRRAAEL